MLLRPEFTHVLADSLLAGKHINLISPHGQGRRRTLKDLKSVLEQHIHIEQFDLLRDQGAELISIMTKLESLSEQNLLILHNYHLCGDERVVKRLFHMKKTVLLTVSEVLDTEVAQAVTPLLLPPLKLPELINEIENSGVFSLNAVQTKELAETLLLETSPYTCLEKFAKQAANTK